MSPPDRPTALVSPTALPGASALAPAPRPQAPGASIELVRQMPVGRLLLVQEEDQAPAPLGTAAAALLRRCRGPVSLCPGLMESKLPLWALWDWLGSRPGVAVVDDWRRAQVVWARSAHASAQYWSAQQGPLPGSAPQAPLPSTARTLLIEVPQLSLGRPRRQRQEPGDADLTGCLRLTSPDRSDAVELRVGGLSRHFWRMRQAWQSAANDASIELMLTCGPRLLVVPANASIELMH